MREDLSRVTPCEHGGRVIEASETMRDVIDFSANINPFLHPRIKSAVGDAIKTACHYPDYSYVRFREAVGEYLGVPPNAIVPANGSVELIRLCAWALLAKRDKVLIPAPTFGEYELACRLNSAEPLIVPWWNQRAFRRDLFSALADEDIRMVCLCNPNNPTGKELTRETVIEIAAKCRETNTFLLVDEVFVELADPEHSVASAQLDDAFVLRSLTKSFSIPGIRAAYGVTNPTLANILNNLRLPWNLNSIAEAVTVDLLKDCESYLHESRTKIAEQRKWLMHELQKMPGVAPLESEANFIMLDISASGLPSSDFAREMMRHGCQVRDCRSFRLTGDDYIRIAVRTETENARLLDAIKEVASRKA